MLLLLLAWRRQDRLGGGEPRRGRWSCDILRGGIKTS